MSKKINDAIMDALVDANERLRKENAVLKAELEHTKKAFKEKAARCDAWMKTAHTIETADFYHPIFCEALYTPGVSGDELYKLYRSLNKKSQFGTSAARTQRIQRKKQ